MRTIICSDAHGYPRLIEDALAAASHRPGIDRFVYAGDLIDRGPDPVGCFELVDRLADVALFGNHDVACALGLSVSPQDPRARVLASRLRDRALDPSGKWRLCAEVDDVLVVHGGLGEHWRDALAACGGDVTTFAAFLNERFRVEFAAALDAGSTEWSGSLLGFDGPLWYRPLEDGLPLTGVRQVVGHTPIEFHKPGTEAVLADLGVRLVDPGAYRFDGLGDTGGHFRCAVIEDGEVEILTNDVSPRRPRDLSLACY